MICIAMAHLTSSWRLVFSGFGKPRPEPTDKPGDFGFDWGTPDAYQFFLELGPLSNANTRYFKVASSFGTS